MDEMRENCCEAKDIFTSIFGTRTGRVETFFILLLLQGS